MSSSSSSIAPVRRGALRLSVAEGMLHAVMLGASESYLGTLAVELGHRDRALALLATVPLFAGAAAQFTSAWLAAVFGGRKRLVVIGAFVQAATLVGFQQLAVAGERELAPFLLIKVLFWTAGSVIVPAWSAWMADLTTDSHRSRYFAWRSAWISVALVVSFVLAGRLLHAYAARPLVGYAWLFIAAFLARALSALLLAYQLEPRTGAASPHAPARLREAIFGSRWQTALYVAALMFAANVSTPFFTPYMLRELELDYAQFARLMSAAIVAKAVVFPLCHPLALRFGMQSVLLVSGLGVSVTPALWYVARAPDQLFVVELFAGSVWAAWEFTTFQLLLSASHERFRLAFLSLSGTLTATAQVAGALAGTLLLERFNLSYLDVFLASAALRFLSLVLLLVNLQRLLPAKFEPRRIATRIESVRPNAGAVTRLLKSDDPKR